MVPGLGALDEDVRLRAEPARIVQRADPDRDQIGAGGNPQKQHTAAFRAERPGYAVSAIRRLDVNLWLALGDPETGGGNPQPSRRGATALALAVAAVTEQREDRF